MPWPGRRVLYEGPAPSRTFEVNDLPCGHTFNFRVYFPHTRTRTRTHRHSRWRDADDARDRMRMPA